MAYSVKEKLSIYKTEVNNEIKSSLIMENDVSSHKTIKLLDNHIHQNGAECDPTDPDGEVNCRVSNYFYDKKVS